MEMCTSSLPSGPQLPPKQVGLRGLKRPSLQFSPLVLRGGVSWTSLGLPDIQPASYQLLALYCSETAEKVEGTTGGKAL